MINGTCAGRFFALGFGRSEVCGDLSIDVDFASAAFAVRNWTITVRGNHVYDRIAGPKHRIDLSFSARATDAPRPTAPRPGLSVHPSPPPLRRPATRRRARCRTASSASRTRRRRHAAARRTRTRGPATSSRAPLLRAPSRGAPPCTRSRRPTPRNTPSRASTAPRRRRPWTSSRPAATRRHRTDRRSEWSGRRANRCEALGAIFARLVRPRGAGRGRGLRRLTGEPDPTRDTRGPRGCERRGARGAGRGRGGRGRGGGGWAWALFWSCISMIDFVFIPIIPRSMICRKVCMSGIARSH